MRLSPKRISRGYSLVELLAVISASSIILSLSAVLIHRIMHEQSQAQHFQDAERSALRLSSQFRRDVHRASDVSIQESEEPRGLTLQMANTNQQIVYQFEQGSVIRLLSNNGRSVSREEFPFPAETEWTMREEADPQRLLLVAHNGPQELLTENSQPVAKDQLDSKRPAAKWITPVSLRVEACLGRGPRVAFTAEDGGASK